MNGREFHDAFLRMEAEMGLFEERVAGIRFWERVRQTIRRRVQSALLKGQRPSSDSGDDGEAQPGVGRRVLDAACGAVEPLVDRNPYLAGDREVLFFGHSRRTLEPDGTWWDPYCDPLLLDAPYRYLHLERPRLRTHKRPARTADIGYTDVIEWSRRAYMKLPGDRVDLTGRERELLSRIEAEMDRTFGADVDVATIVRNRLAERRIGLVAYSALLARIDPDVAVVVPSLDKGDFIESCKRRDVPVVELQHGLIDERQPTYSYPAVDREVAPFPDYFLTFSDAWTDFVRTRLDFPIPDRSIRTVGYRYVESKLGDYPRRDGDDVLFISQHFENLGRPLARTAVDLAVALDGERSVVYKLHPIEVEEDWKEKYPELADSGVEVVDDDGRELYDLFAGSAAQVGVSSTALYEGLAWGLRTFVLDLPDVDLFRRMDADWGISVVESAGAIADALGTEPERTIAFEDVFEPDAVANFEAQLDAIRRGE